MKNSVLICSVLSLFFSVSIAEDGAVTEINAVRSPEPSQVIAITGVSLIDGTGASPVENATIVVQGNRFIQAGESVPSIFPTMRTLSMAEALRLSRVSSFRTFILACLALPISSVQFSGSNAEKWLLRGIVEFGECVRELDTGDVDFETFSDFRGAAGALGECGHARRIIGQDRRSGRSEVRLDLVEEYLEEG